MKFNEKDLLEAEDEDISYLLDLLREYAATLREQSELVYKLRMRTELGIFSGVLASFVLGLGFFRFSPIGEWPIGLFLVLAPSITMVFAVRTNISRISLQSESVSNLHRVVERLVRRASQLEDHGITNLTRKIAFDLRIAEAEGALIQSAKLIRPSAKDRA